MSHSGSSDRSTRSKNDSILASLTAAIKETSQNVSDMRSEINGKFADLDKKFSDKFGELETHIGNMQKKFEEDL